MPEKYKRFNILYLHDVVDIGGAERSIFYLIENLDSEKFLPIIAIPSEGPFTEDLKGIGVEIHFLKFPRIFNLNIFKKLKTIYKLVRLIKSKNIDIIHSNGFRTNIYAGIAGRLTGKRVIWHARNLITSERIDSDRLFIFLPHTLICLTEAIRKRFYKNGIPIKKCIVIQNGVDTDEFDYNISGDSIRKEFNISKDSPVIGITSRIVSGKGHDIFLRAARIVADEFPDAKFLIVGSHISKEHTCWEEYIKKFVKEIGISEKVIFTGFRTDLPQILAAIDIYVLASYAEPSGRTHLEAMAMAKSIVATKSGGTSEIAVDGETAILVEPGNHKAMADAIISLLKNPERRILMGRKARQRSEQTFSIKRNVRETESLYLQQPLKILHVIHSSELSGPQRHLLDIAKAIDKSKFTIEVACPDGWLSNELKKNNIIVYEVELKDKVSIYSLLSLYRIVRRGAYNILHGHMGRTGFYVKCAGFLTGIPVIVTEHLLAYDHSWIKNPIKRSLHLLGHRFSNRMAELVIAVSDEARNAYIKRQKIFPEKILTIHNFVDTDIVATEHDAESIRREFGINKDEIIVGYVGRLDWRKGLKTIIDAASGLVDMKFLIVGDGEDKESFLNEIKKKGLEKNFILTGTRQDIPALIKAMDIFIFPSHAPYESFGMVVIEAMSEEKSVIASDIGPVREIIVDGKDGILIPQKDPNALRSAIIKLIKNKELRKQIGEQGRKTVIERFSLSKAIKKIEEVYERIIDR